MKINITTNNDVIGNIINSSAKIRSYYTDESEKKIGEDMDKALIGIDIHKNFAGGSFSYKCAPSYKEYGEAEFNMELNDRAFIMGLQIATKISKIVSPLYDMAKSMIKFIDNIHDEIKTAVKSYNTEYAKRFGKKETYCVFALMEESIEAGDVVIVRDNGYENDDSIQVICANRYWSENSLDVLTKIVKTKYLDKITFSEMSEQEAYDKAEAMGPATEKDVKGTLEARKILAAHNTQ